GRDAPAVLALRSEPRADAYQRTADLVGAIKQRGGFDVMVSAYPEGHPQSPSDDHDLAARREQAAAGADAATTQMFFDNAHYLRYRDRVDACGIGIPIVPG